MITKQICIEEFIDAPLLCGEVEPEIRWIVPGSDCIVSPCVDCDEECITITMEEDCPTNYVEVVITYPGSSCDPIKRKIGICESSSQCNACEHCDNGVCVDKCSGPCDSQGMCVECLSKEDCEGDKICANGACQCPPGTTDLGENVCRECLVDENCPDCYTCEDIKCVPKVCPDGRCFEDNCVECINSGDCGINECCVDNNCNCCPGFSWDSFLNMCVPNGECTDLTDCPACHECVNGDCVKKVCPNGYVCYNDECYKECSPVSRYCDDEEKHCLRYGDDYICVECPTCEETDPDIPGEGTNPRPDDPSNPGTPCSLNSDCGPGEKCGNGACVDCPECLDEQCVEDFKIEKGNCQVRGVLETTEGCNCPQLTWSVEVHERSGDLIRFRLRLRQGNAYVSGINNIPLLRDIDVDDPMPLSGTIDVRTIAKGTYKEEGLGTYHEISERPSLSFEGVDEIITTRYKLDKAGSTCVQGSSGKTFIIENVSIVFTLPSMDIEMPDGCKYSVDKEEIYYSINREGGNGYLSNNEFYNTTGNFLRYRVLTSNGTRNPIFYWYSGSTPQTSTLIRKAYSTKEGSTKFVDGWIGKDEGININRYIRLESDCSCEGVTYFKCEEDPTRLYYCEPDLTNLNYTLSECNRKIEFHDNVIPVCDANETQGYEIYINGTNSYTAYPIDGELTIERTFSLNEDIEDYQIKLENVSCEDCYPKVNIIKPTYSFNLESYNCNTKELGVSVSGGSGNYKFYIDNEEWDPEDPILLITGQHTFTVEDIDTGCSQNFSFNVDCCDLFSIDAENQIVCGTVIDEIDFEMTGGSPNYLWAVYDSKGGNEIDSGDGPQSVINADLDGYTGPLVYIEAYDAHGCKAEKTVSIQYADEVDVDISNRSYCEGDPDVSITVSRNAGKLPIAYELKQGGNTLITGTFTSNNSTVVIQNPNTNGYLLELEDDNGCTLNKPFSLVERECPNPVITTNPGEVCQDKVLTILANISSGSNPYSWTVEYNNSEIANGSGSNISVNTGTTYTSVPGDYTFTISVVDANNKTDTKNVTYTVLEEYDDECLECATPPSIEVISDIGWSVDPDDVVELSLTGTGESYRWYVNGVSSGSNDKFYPDTTTPGTYTIYARVEYSPYCFVNTGSKTLTVSEPCTCEYSIKLVSGWGSDNDEIITSTTTNSSPLCFGDEVVAEVMTSGCSESEEYSWRLEYDNQLVKAGTGDTFTWTPPMNSSGGQYSLILAGMDGDCVIPAITYKRNFELCRTCEIQIADIEPIEICDGGTAEIGASVSNIWDTPGGVKFLYKVNGSVYAEYPADSSFTCMGQSACQRNQNISGLSVGTHNIEVEVWENGAQSCSASTTTTVTVRPMSHEECRDCTENTGEVTITGCSGSGQCTIQVTEGKTATLNGSATGTPGNFTYQWKHSGSNVGNGSSVQVGPFDYGDINTFTLEATDEHGCKYTKSVVLNTVADCSGTPVVNVSPIEACEGDDIDISWDLSSLYKKEEYTVELWMQYGGGGSRIDQNLPYNGSRTVTMLSGDTGFYIVARRVVGSSTLCTKNSPYAYVDLKECITCTGQVNSITQSPTTLCPSEQVTLTAHVNGDSSGYLYEWREGTASNGLLIGTGQVITGYVPSVPFPTITVRWWKTGCSNGSRAYILNQRNTCCSGTPDPTISYHNDYCNNTTVTIAKNGGNNWSATLYSGTSCSGTPIGQGQNNYTVTNATVGKQYTLCYSNPLCPSGGGSKTFTIAQQSACCNLTINPSASGIATNTSCPNGTVNLNANTTGSDSGWSYTWRRGSTVIGTTKNISNYQLPSSLPVTISLEISKPNCTGDTKSFVITQDGSCCSDEPNPSMTYDSNFCTNGNIEIRRNGSSEWTTTAYLESSTCSGNQTVDMSDQSTLVVQQAPIGSQYTVCWSKPDCPSGGGSKTFTVEQQHSCCGLTANPRTVMNEPEGGAAINQACVNGKINLQAQTSGSTTGWTFEWVYNNNTIATTANLNGWDGYTSLPFNLTFRAIKDGCAAIERVVAVTQSSQCCQGQPSSISSSSGTNMCPGQSTTLSIPGVSGWTYTWREGTNSNGPSIGTGSSVNFTPNTYPKTVTVWGTNTYCPGTHTASITLNQGADCCPSGITLQKICDPDKMVIRVNGLDTQDIVQINSQTPMTGPHPSNRREYTWNGTGTHSVTIKVYRDGCPNQNNYLYSLNLVR